MKYFGINLAKAVKDLYTENNKIPLIKAKDYINKWRAIPCLWVRSPISLRYQFSQTNL